MEGEESQQPPPTSLGQLEKRLQGFIAAKFQEIMKQVVEEHLPTRAEELQSPVVSTRPSSGPRAQTMLSDDDWNKCNVVTTQQGAPFQRRPAFTLQTPSYLKQEKQTQARSAAIRQELAKTNAAAAAANPLDFVRFLSADGGDKKSASALNLDDATRAAWTSITSGEDIGALPFMNPYTICWLVLRVPAVSGAFPGDEDEEVRDLRLAEEAVAPMGACAQLSRKLVLAWRKFEKARDADNEAAIWGIAEDVRASVVSLLRQSTDGKQRALITAPLALRDADVTRKRGVSPSPEFRPVDAILQIGGFSAVVEYLQNFDGGAVPPKFPTIRIVVLDGPGERADFVGNVVLYATERYLEQYEQVKGMQDRFEAELLTFKLGVGPRLTFADHARAAFTLASAVCAANDLSQIPVRGADTFDAFAARVNADVTARRALGKAKSQKGTDDKGANGNKGKGKTRKGKADDNKKTSASSTPSSRSQTSKRPSTAAGTKRANFDSLVKNFAQEHQLIKLSPGVLDTYLRSIWGETEAPYETSTWDFICERILPSGRFHFALPAKEDPGYDVFTVYRPDDRGSFLYRFGFQPPTTVMPRHARPSRACRADADTNLSSVRHVADLSDADYGVRFFVLADKSLGLAAADDTSDEREDDDKSCAVEDKEKDMEEDDEEDGGEKKRQKPKSSSRKRPREPAPAFRLPTDAAATAKATADLRAAVSELVAGKRSSVRVMGSDNALHVAVAGDFALGTMSLVGASSVVVTYVGKTFNDETYNTITDEDDDDWPSSIYNNIDLGYFLLAPDDDRSTPTSPSRRRR